MELLPFTKDDFPTLISSIDTYEEHFAFSGTSLEFPLTENVLSDYIADKRKIAFKFCVDGQTVGHADIFLENPVIPRLCRIVIFKVFRGKGYGNKITMELVKYCVKKLNLKIIELLVFDENKIAQKCYKKAGFKVNPANCFVANFNGKETKVLSMLYFDKSIHKE